MKEITFSQDINILTIDDCLKFYKDGISITVNEGSKVTFRIENKKLLSGN
ncbi:hypothetical protein CLPU_1c00090 [Gottschalkia purinilytica]|uniref:Uncharacterized protein n=1 Tax=Gottschalkia purinilytica TaxID=1503 RepID=A0A0L0WEF0_GOTPU|nr:hypothetical protein [Gottschalkia purinilytica]KNF09844.1 hypothetical protein CLPU_1c00090 [Gottschalkia purinilytica]